MTEHNLDGLFCSFCGKHQDDVKALIAAPKANICNECAVLCLDVLLARVKRAYSTVRLPSLELAEGADVAP